MPPSAHIVGRLPPFALLDLRRLAVLAEVARCGSFSAAAEAMCFTPSAVSQQMSALARDTGVVLFERRPTACA
jgi:DNA-binding transcriptional LysR family regulator